METDGNFQNANPIVYEIGPAVQKKETYEYDDENELEEMTPEEIFEHIRCINDPEHPLTLEQLKVVTVSHSFTNSSS
jgi:alanine racemase